MYLLCGSLCVTVLIYDVNIENRSLMNINFLIKIPFSQHLAQKLNRKRIKVPQECQQSSRVYSVLLFLTILSIKKSKHTIVQNLRKIKHCQNDQSINGWLQNSSFLHHTPENQILGDICLYPCMVSNSFGQHTNLLNRNIVTMGLKKPWLYARSSSVIRDNKPFNVNIR